VNDRDALYHTVHDYPGGAEALAPRMGLASSTLQSMANPNLDSHGWSVKRFKQVMHLSNDVRPLEAICTEFNGIFVRLTSGDGRPLDEIYRDLTRLGKEFGDIPRLVTAALKDGRIKQKEFERIKREVMELQQAAAAVVQRLEVMVEQAPANKK
jgi:hypothetical protein